MSSSQENPGHNHPPEHDPSDHRPGPNIIIDKTHYPAPKWEMTGAELKTLGSIAGNFMLFKIVPGPAPDEPIGESETVKLHEGDHFYSLPPGTVGDLLPSVEAEVAEVREHFPDVIVLAGGGTDFFVELPTVELPSGKGWNQKTTRILLPVPASYPTSRPPNFYVAPELTRNGGAPGGKGSPTVVAGKQWAPMCWRPAHSEEARRSLLQCLRFAASRFYEAQ